MLAFFINGERKPSYLSSSVLLSIYLLYNHSSDSHTTMPDGVLVL